MGCQTEVELESNLTFSVTTHDPDTGILTDADAVPPYRIYEDETAVPILTGNMAKLDDANTVGFYTKQIACTAVNGFENNKSYTIYIEATVDGDKGGIAYSFRVTSSSTNIDTLLTRLSATRATYLDYLFSLYFGLVSAVAQAQAGGAATITLAGTSSAVNDFYKGQTVAIYTGTGAGQARAISAYNGGTFVATVSPPWATAPDNTSWYVIMNVGSAIVDDWTDGGRLDLLLDAVKAKTDNLPSGIKKNTALTNFEWSMVLATDHVSPATGKAVTCQRSIDGAAFANCNTVNATEVSAGIYKVDLAASDLNGDVITLKFANVDCDTRLITIKTST